MCLVGFACFVFASKGWIFFGKRCTGWAWSVNFSGRRSTRRTWMNNRSAKCCFENRSVVVSANKYLGCESGCGIMISWPMLKRSPSSAGIMKDVSPVFRKCLWNFAPSIFRGRPCIWWRWATKICNPMHGQFLVSFVAAIYDEGHSSWQAQSFGQCKNGLMFEGAEAWHCLFAAGTEFGEVGRPRPSLPTLYMTLHLKKGLSMSDSLKSRLVMEQYSAVERCTGVARTTHCVLQSVTVLAVLQNFSARHNTTPAAFFTKT